MSKITQCQKVLRHMDMIGPINPMVAIQEYGIMRLASRISDLRKKGYLIQKKLIHGTNRFGEPTHYAEYRLMEEQDLLNG